jgi:hypothetical protein
MSHVLRLCLVSHLLSPVLRLHSLSPVLTSLFLVSCPLSQVSVPCLSAFVSCLTGFVPCFPYSSLRPLTPINCQCPLFCGSIPLFLSFVPLFTVLCSSVSCPLPLVFHTCENARYRTCADIYGWCFKRLAMSWYVWLVVKLWELLDVCSGSKELR